MKLQKAKSILTKIEGIQVIDYEEQPSFDEDYLIRINYYNCDKNPDAKISISSNDAEIIDWIYKLIDFQLNQIWYIRVNDFLAKIKILDIRSAILELWKNINPPSNGFTLIDENNNTLYEFGNDSRDEGNYLFDKYPLV